MYKIASIILIASLLVCIPIVVPASANTSCDKHASFLRNEMVPAWRLAQRGDHTILREAWSSDFHRRLFPSCNMSYDEYFGLKPGKLTNSGKTVEPRNSKKEPKSSQSDRVNVDPDPDWAGATRERILKGKQGDVISVNQNPKRIAPYGSSDCAEIKPAPNRGAIDWDWVVIRNKCSYPIKALVCYYDQGRRSDCVAKKGAKGWGQSDLLSPGETQTSIATTKKLPWFATVMVCDMRDKSDLLCVLPN